MEVIFTESLKRQTWVARLYNWVRALEECRTEGREWSAIR